MASRAEVEADPVNPQAVSAILSKRLPDNALLTCEVGSGTNWYARYLKIRRNMVGSVSGGMPYLIARKFAYPDRPGIAMVGHGAMQMLGNQTLNQVTWEQPVMEGDPKFETSLDSPNFAFDQYVELLGLKGLRISTPQDIDRIWDEALAADRKTIDKGLQRLQKAFA